MVFPNEPVECPHAGTWIWWVDTDRFLGDEVVADLFDVDRTLLTTGVPIQTIRAAVHPDDLGPLLARAQVSIDGRQAYRSSFRVRRWDGLVRKVMSVGWCFYEDDRLQFVGTTIEIEPPVHRGPTLDQLTDEVIAACNTARVLGEPFQIHLLEMVLADIARTTVDGLMIPVAASPAH